MAEAWLCVLATHHQHRHRRAALWWCAAVASETELLRMAARAGLLRYALRMVAAAAAAAVYRLRAAWPLVRAGRLAMYRCRAARHRAVAVARYACLDHNVQFIVATLWLPALVAFSWVEGRAVLAAVLRSVRVLALVNAVATLF